MTSPDRTEAITLLLGDGEATRFEGVAPYGVLGAYAFPE